MSHLSQIARLRKASESIQEVINNTTTEVLRGSLYAAQDIITSQIKTISSLNDEQQIKTITNGYAGECDFLAQ